jgi:hypothetical protein
MIRRGDREYEERKGKINHEKHETHERGTGEARGLTVRARGGVRRGALVKPACHSERRYGFITLERS